LLAVSGRTQWGRVKVSEAALFIFLDGVGLGPADGNNPLATAPMPRLRRLLGGPLVADHPVDRPGLLLRDLDATLGVPGPPQSATGQTALFTGVNAAAVLGEHLSGYPNDPLKALIDEHSILKQVVTAGGRATFANAYGPSYFERVARGTAHHSATTLCVLAAGLPFRTLEDMERGEAVYWDITNHLFKRVHGHETPTVSPAEAGRRLAALAANHDLTLYESFLPDVMAHRGTPAEVQATLAVLDEFLGSVLAHRPAHVTLVLSSDHGHLEAPGDGHTMNPVPLLAVGPGTAHFRQARAITDVTPGILALLEITGTQTQARG